jgi:hypothetical protein
VINIILKRHDHVEPSTVLEALNRVADRILQVEGRGAGAGFSHCVMRDDSHVSSSSSSSSRSSKNRDKACDWKGSLCDGANSNSSSSSSSYQLSSNYNSWKSCNDSSVPPVSAKKKMSKFTSPTHKSDHHHTNHSPYLFRIFVIFGLLLCCFMLLHVL